MTPAEIKERTTKVVIKCYYKILEKENARLAETYGEYGLTTLETMDIYQKYRDKAYDKYGEEMFFEDFYDLFDKIYKEVKEEKEWEAMIVC